MKRNFLSLIVLLYSLHVVGQMHGPKPEILLAVGDSLWPMRPNTTISELRRGWEIQGYPVGRKLIRYLWGERAVQSTSDSCPVFIIHPQDATLADYALIRLRRKKNYRRFASAVLMECPYQRAEPHEFQIEPVDDLSFRVQPHVSLPPGEYAWVCLTQKPTTELGDVVVYDFRIP